MGLNSIEPDDGYRAVIRRSRDVIGSVLGTESPQGKVMITTANWITLFRVAVIPVFLLTFFSDSPAMRIVASTAFILGAISDYWDGKLARMNREVTPFGDFMDPLADKALVLSAFWAILIKCEFGDYFTFAVVWVVLITLREVGLTVLRIVAIEEGSSLKTSFWGKLKTTIQLITLISILVALNLHDFVPEDLTFAGYFHHNNFYVGINVLFFLSMLGSLVSGWFYVLGFKKRQD
ncbi:MAG: CDP-diacylglycerol--glycerol-3-phosphate 3-phosphatidyltransferase [Calditrichaeota bacterium]|jgi:CDP-diacylglycerol---glycerol-3-phosphate 3-phosphatidyltransferase|nr:CDP-diacylglycerol--glycerol-3-phosphate 3-phosphatidyltransferase [Calditrichota bacterium]MBT7616689.1 CDP-diacylglycerol--glycerol-3-phosphate 3-phosphatidyltransferase [Calditrichota bacterium]MBT7789951.1 CDP-diacylglycerol--glycerol-3-phosphate 3-phosphatidyltransferase [Calditrichota bacterium]